MFEEDLKLLFVVLKKYATASLVDPFIHNLCESQKEAEFSSEQSTEYFLLLHYFMHYLMV